jgi:predicted RNA-binding protein associated with RNAse of E/G family
MSEITVQKRNHLGEVVLSYRGEIVERGSHWVCLRAPFERPDVDLGFVVLRQGDLFTEWFFSDRWYNIFQVEDVDTGELKGWYCNITRPSTITQDTVSADDLALDVFVTPTATVLLLDEDEFTTLDLPVDERMEALRAVESIRTAVAEYAPPFDQIRPQLS